jgi:hypothetical protein
MEDILDDGSNSNKQGTDFTKGTSWGNVMNFPNEL